MRISLSELVISPFTFTEFHSSDASIHMHMNISMLYVCLLVFQRHVLRRLHTANSFRVNEKCLYRYFEKKSEQTGFLRKT